MIVTALWFTLVISLSIQAAFFVFAATLRTDKVTDLSYSLTFLTLAVVLLGRTGTPAWPHFAVAGMVMLWALRLGGYLFWRILHIGHDSRFDGVRDRLWAFLQFWVLQGIAVWLILLPVTLWFTLDRQDAASTAGWMVGGGIIWAVGLAIETVADVQKYRDRRRTDARARWTDTGLWRYSRHPNYFGELLCWWGLYVAVLPGLGWWMVPGALGPLAITVLLLYVTGIPTLEQAWTRKWGRDPAFLAYRERTNRLVPWRGLPMRRERLGPRA